MSAVVPASPAIYRLSIERFRGIKNLLWYPSRGVNVILGGGDVGKTTILDAVAMLPSPTNPSVLSDTDYLARDDSAGFVIEAVLLLPPGLFTAHRYLHFPYIGSCLTQSDNRSICEAGRRGTRKLRGPRPILLRPRTRHASPSQHGRRR